MTFGNTSFKSNKNHEILITTIDYILSIKRFDEPLFLVDMLLLLISLKSLENPSKSYVTRTYFFFT